MLALSLTAERTALADHTILSTFEQASVAWQAIPHWDTHDPAQSRVRGDVTYSFGWGNEESALPLGGPPVRVRGCHVPFRVTLAQATADTPDALLANVIARTVDLARLFDRHVLAGLAKPAVADSGDWYRPLDTGVTGDSQNVQGLLTALIDGRRLLEDAGYQAPSCLITSTAHYKAINQWVDVGVASAGLLLAAQVNALHRTSRLDQDELTLMLGRRRDIPASRAAEASPGEEPVDLAVSVLPSLEIVGANGSGELELGVRIRYATRIKDERGIVVFHAPSSDHDSASSAADDSRGSDGGESTSSHGGDGPSDGADDHGA